MEHFIVVRVQLGASKAKIANLQVTVFIEEQVARLEIPVKDARTMYVFQTP